MKKTLIFTLAIIGLLACKKEKESDIEKYYQGTWEVQVNDLDTSFQMVINAKGAFNYTLELDSVQNQLDGNVNNNGGVSGNINANGFAVGSISGQLTTDGKGTGIYTIFNQNISWSAKKK